MTTIAAIQKSYLAGVEAERARIVKYLEDVPPKVIDDWGLNAIGNLIDLLKDGAHLEEKTVAQTGSKEP